MGFLSRLFIPRGVRRAMHPARTVKRAATPKVFKKARRSMHPVSNAAYAFERSLNTNKGRGRKQHRSTDTAHVRCTTGRPKRRPAAAEAEPAYTGQGRPRLAAARKLRGEAPYASPPVMSPGPHLAGCSVVMASAGN